MNRSIPERSEEAKAAIERYVFDRNMVANDPTLDLFISWFRRRYGNHLEAVIFFGSCVSKVTRSVTSFPDFFIIVDTYRAHGSFPGAVMHSILPPELYHLNLPQENRPSGLDCKYYLLSRKDLLRLTSSSAPDLYVAGRLSKRAVCAYFRDETSRSLISGAIYQAAWNVILWSSALLTGPLNDEDLFLQVLGLSYRAETRMEDERKVEALYAAGQTYYRHVFGPMVECMVRDGLLVRTADGRLARNVSGAGPSPEAVEGLLTRSRKRAKMRWPKMMLTVDNWIDQLLMKLERTHGIRIEIPPWERKIVLITGWRHYFKLKKKGKVR